MKFALRSLCLLGGLIPVAPALAADYVPTYNDKALADGDKAAIDAAVPSEAFAEPATPRRVLVYSATAGFRHGSIPWGVYALQRIGEATGAYEAVVSNSLDNFTPEALKQFDAICLLNTTGTLFMPPQDQRANYSDEDWAALEKQAVTLMGNLLEYLRNNPRGLVGIHAATDACYDNAEYGKMIDGYFLAHPWTSDKEISLHVDEPDHALIHGVFEPREYRFKEEIYEFRDEPYSRANVRVLLSLDEEKSETPKKPSQRADGDYPVAWISAYGRSRIFYTSLGHRQDIYTNPVMLKHYLKGIQWALGDVQANVLPSSQVGRGYPDAAGPAGILAAAVADLSDGYTVGEDQVAVDTLAWVSAQAAGDDSLRSQFRQSLHQLLQAGSASDDLKRLALYHLRAVGDESSVQVVRILLGNSVLRAPALDVLTAMADVPEARRAVGQDSTIFVPGTAPDPLKGGGAATLQALAKDEAQPAHVRAAAFAELFADGKFSPRDLQAELAQAASEAFDGLLGSLVARKVKRAIPALTAALDELPPERQGPVIVALAELDAEKAFDKITRLAVANPDLLADYVHACTKIGTADAVDPLLSALATDERLAQEGLNRTPGEKFSRALLKRLDKTGPENKAAIIIALGERGYSKALPGIVPYLASSDRGVAVAAVKTCTWLWSPKLVPDLLKLFNADTSQSTASAVARILSQKLDDAAAKKHAKAIRASTARLPEGPVREQMAAVLERLPGTE